MTFIGTLASFLVAIAILVAIHEFGHFWVAKKIGVKVLRFSIGFGKVLTSFKRGETEYTLCAIPLGGYVKMLDENESEVDPSEKHRAFSQQSVYKRFAIVAAGPLANFLLAIIIYTAIFIIGVDGIKPVVGTTQPGSIISTSGIKSGDELLSINNIPTPSISEFSINFIQNIENTPLYVDVLSAKKSLKTHRLSPRGDFLSNPEQGVDKYLGFEFALPKIPAIINKVLPNSPADLSGLKGGDKIIAANGENIESWHDLVALIKSHENKAINLLVDRQSVEKKITLIPKLENGSVKAGVSVLVPDEYLDDWKVTVKKEPIDAFLSANNKVYQLTVLNLKIIKKMIMGEASVDQLSGPISIANYAGKSAKVGLISFLSFLALISIGLGLLNLLPIPLLDGGHLFFYLIEIIKGSALSQSAQQGFAKIGLFVILSLTIIALYNDLTRLL